MERTAALPISSLSLEYTKMISRWQNDGQSLYEAGIEQLQTSCRPVIKNVTFHPGEWLHFDNTLFRRSFRNTYIRNFSVIDKPGALSMTETAGTSTKTEVAPMRIFISYGHPESEICKRIYDALKDRGT